MSDATNHEARLRELERRDKEKDREIKSLEAQLARALAMLGMSRQMVDNQ